MLFCRSESRQTFYIHFLKLITTGYDQANIVIISSKYAGDFQNFVKKNSGALPLLFASKPGQFTAPEICFKESSDIRTDVPLYLKLVDGKVQKELADLKSIFYLCFTFIKLQYYFTTKLFLVFFWFVLHICNVITTHTVYLNFF